MQPHLRRTGEEIEQLALVVPEGLRALVRRERGLAVPLLDMEVLVRIVERGREAVHEAPRLIGDAGLRVAHQLPQSLTPPGDPVDVCEGEKMVGHGLKVTKGSAQIDIDAAGQPSAAAPR